MVIYLKEGGKGVGGGKKERGGGGKEGGGVPEEGGINIFKNKYYPFKSHFYSPYMYK